MSGSNYTPSDSALPNSEFAPLGRLLGVADDAFLALSEALASFGVSTLEDVAYLHNSNEVRDSNIPTVTRGKLLRIAEFMDEGGRLEDVSSMRDIAQWRLGHQNSGNIGGIGGPSAPVNLDDRRGGSSSSPPSSDQTVGLDVGGRVFYIPLSALTNGSSYFEARFGRNFDPGVVHRDERGRDIYFVDADGELLRHVLEHLRRGVRSWPTFRQDPVLWRRLRSEAEYFGVDSMIEALRVTHSCNLDNTDKGVLYWLGTKKGAAEYSNPYEIGAVTLDGTFNDFPDLMRGLSQRRHESQRAFVQYRPETLSVDEDITCRGDEGITCRCQVLWCQYSRHRSSLVITLTDVSVRPTHYSLRYGDCHGMDTWDFEASVDLVTWDNLHEARGDPHIRKPPRKARDLLQKMLSMGHSTEEKKRIATSFIEGWRHTWALDPAPTKFYRHFRFIGVGAEYFEEIRNRLDDNGDDGSVDDAINCDCMHGVGFELFGDVQEC